MYEERDEGNSIANILLRQWLDEDHCDRDTKSPPQPQHNTDKNIHGTLHELSRASVLQVYVQGSNDGRNKI